MKERLSTERIAQFRKMITHNRALGNQISPQILNLELEQMLDEIEEARKWHIPREFGLLKEVEVRSELKTTPIESVDDLRDYFEKFENPTEEFKKYLKYLNWRYNLRMRLSLTNKEMHKMVKDALADEGDSR